MRVYEMVFSPTGGTRRVADALTNAITAEPIAVDLCEAKADLSAVRPRSVDLFVVAVPVFVGRIPAVCAERLAAVCGGGARAVAVAVYGNRAFEDALRELRDVLTQAGFCCVAAVAAVAEHSIARSIAAGRPDEADRRQLAEFGECVRRRLQEPDVSQTVEVPGNIPYRQRGGASQPPAVGDGCTRCGLCAEKCPLQIISPRDPRQVQPDRCIGCLRCVAFCPTGARRAEPGMVAAVTEKLSRLCPSRSENQLFL